MHFKQQRLSSEECILPAPTTQLSDQQGWRRPLLVGLAFGTQLVSCVPCGPNDVPVDVVITPEGPHLCSPRARKEWETVDQ